ncbi:hypothetical protein L204_104613 [Cryptococcus depauperatus]|nr:hypothetical protein L204_03480 [Cryptococcus depauperatus CBS 7855]
MRLHHYTTWAALAVLPRGMLATPMDERSAPDIIHQLNLAPNVEKGYYAQTFQDPDTVDNRSVSTLIYYLLEGDAGESEWHRVDATEVWHFYAGAPLVLSLLPGGGASSDGAVARHTLGPDIFDEQTPQVVIPKDTWQSARSLGAWTLVGTTMAPGFVPAGFQFAPPGAPGSIQGEMGGA